jgi:hypothetical protein
MTQCGHPTTLQSKPACLGKLAGALVLRGDKQHARSAPVPNLKVEATPERIARGKADVDGFCSMQFNYRHNDRRCERRRPSPIPVLFVPI